MKRKSSVKCTPVYQNYFFFKILNINKAVIILLTYLLNYYGINNIPNQVISVVKKIVQMKNNGILVKLANAISWSQNENDAANVSLLPFIIIGAGHGTMSVKVISRLSSTVLVLK